MTHRYASGRLLGLVGERGVALLPPEVGSDAAEQLRTRMDKGADVAELLDAVAAAMGTTLTGIPNFAFVVREGTAVRVAVRGGVRVTTESRGSTATTSGHGVAMLAESVVEDIIGTRVEEDGADDDAATLPASSGVVWCSRIESRWGSEAVAPVDADATLAPAAEEAPLAPHGIAVLRGEGGEAKSTIEFGNLWGAEDGEDDTSAADDEAPPTMGAPSAPDQLPEPEAPQPSFPAPEPPASVARPTPEVRQAPAAPVTPVEGGLIVGIPDFDASPEEVAPPVVSSQEPPKERPESPKAKPRESEPLGEGDHDGETISAAAMKEMRVETSESIPTDTPRPELRPRVVLSTGLEFEIGPGLVIGRRPTATRVTGDPPQLVAVPSPQQDISRNHLEIRAEGSAVVAIDLDSTNGTILNRAGKDPLRLHPRESTVLTPSDVLDLGDGVTITYLEEP